MKNMKEALMQAKKENYAVPAFNIFDYTSAHAVIRAGEKLQTPIILQTSTGTVKHYGAKALSGMLRGMRQTAAVHTYLHLDHCTDVNLAKECVDCGWDSIMFDGSKYSFEENVRLSKEVVEYAHTHNICVEGELGTIEGAEDEIKVKNAKLADFGECLLFVKETGIDYFAPAVGTAHGVYKGNPKIQFSLIKQLSDNIQEPIVIHGGSGLPDETFRELVKCGASKINISTALKHAYFRGWNICMEQNVEDCSPLNVEKAIEEEIYRTAEHHIQIFRL